MSNVSVDPLALHCVEAGLIESIHVRIDKSGFATKVVPTRRLISGDGPFHVFKKYDWSIVSEFLRDNASTYGISTEPTPPSSPLVEKGKGKAPGGRVIGIPKNWRESSELHSQLKLGSIKRNGVENILPRDSLTVYEFTRPDPHLTARTFVVAERIGEAKAVSRITTDLEMRIGGCSSLHEWWAAASAEQRWKLLSTRKVSGEAKQGLPENLSRLLDVECPFSDARIEVETLNVEDEEYSGGVSFASY